MHLHVIFLRISLPAIRCCFFATQKITPDRGLGVFQVSEHVSRQAPLLMGGDICAHLIFDPEQDFSFHAACCRGHIMTIQGWQSLVQ